VRFLADLKELFLLGEPFLGLENSEVLLSRLMPPNSSLTGDFSGLFSASFRF
jgi:hypothetical protein